ncbi:MAG: capsid cement protein [Pseudolabrys sp.]
MKNNVQEHDRTVDVVTPSGGMTAGVFYLVGALYGVAALTTLEGETNVLHRDGIFTLPKTTTEAWTQGQQMFWNNGTGKFTTTAAGNKPVGIAAVAAGADDVEGSVILDEVPSGIANAIAGVGAGYKIARGVHQQAAASDTVVTGLANVVACGVTFRDGPTVKQLFASASIGDQAGAPAAGSILLKTFKPTAVDNVTPTAATDFTDNLSLNWWAIGT